MGVCVGGGVLPGATRMGVCVGGGVLPEWVGGWVGEGCYQNGWVGSSSCKLWAYRYSPTSS